MILDKDVQLVDSLAFDEKEKQSAQRKALAMEELLKSKGWAVLDEYLRTQLEAYGSKLLSEEDPKQALKLQTAYKVLVNVLMQPAQFITIGRSLQSFDGPEALEE